MAYALGWAWCPCVSAVVQLVELGSDPEGLSVSLLEGQAWTSTVCIWLDSNPLMPDGNLANHIPAGNTYKQLPLPALRINSAHCHSVYLGSLISSEQDRHILYLFRLQSPPCSKMSCVFPWLWKNESTLLLCGFIPKESLMAFIFSTHRGVENKDRRVFRFRDCIDPADLYWQLLSSLSV